MENCQQGPYSIKDSALNSPAQWPREGLDRSGWSGKARQTFWIRSAMPTFPKPMKTPEAEKRSFVDQEVGRTCSAR